MSSPSEHVPKFVAAKTSTELQKKLAVIQQAEGGRVQVISIYFDPAKVEHLAWYYPIRYHGSGVF